MMTNSRMMKRKKMFLIRSLCLLPGIQNLFVHKIHSLMQYFRVQHEEIELKTITSQSQPEAGPSCLAVTNHLEAQSL
ncbi:hypothetical protein BDR03DRAFT_439351 [Suillus americanus]|nr:hypothetical protein BDR03DRAFT_439351 [Suillus americanus]